MSAGFKEARRTFGEDRGSPEGSGYDEVEGGPQRWVPGEILGSSADHRHMALDADLHHRLLQKRTAACRSICEDQLSLRPECRKDQARQAAAGPEVDAALRGAGERGSGRLREGGRMLDVWRQVPRSEEPEVPTATENFLDRRRNHWKISQPER